MDELDRKILYEISENARESHNLLAKKVRCSREVFDYRIKKLIESGVITGCQARVNISNFIYGGYVLLIQTNKLSLTKEKTILSKISRNHKTQYIGKLSGEYDIIVGFTIKKLSELSKYVDFVNASFGVNKSKYTLITMIQEYKDSFKNIFAKESEENKIVSMPECDKILSLDNIDKKIISELGKNSEVPSWKISEKTNITDVAVRKRIQNLIDKKIILNFRTMIDITKLNYQSYFIFIKSNPQTEKIESEFLNFLSRENKVTYSVKTIGEYNFVITLLIKNNLELRDFIYNLRDKYSDMILEIHTSNIFEMPYHTQLAKSILE